MAFILIALVVHLSAGDSLWRSPSTLPGYPKLPEEGGEWKWLSYADKIFTASLMTYSDYYFKGKKPVFNYYIVSECKDEYVNRMYRAAIENAIMEIEAKKRRFVELYPQFSYMLKLKLQLSDGPINDNVFNIPVYVLKQCFGDRTYATTFRSIHLMNPVHAIHEMTHTIGSNEFYYGPDPLDPSSATPYSAFLTAWGVTGDIGDNTLSWYALSLSWSWLYFYDVHPGYSETDYAAKLPFKVKYRTVTGGGIFEESGMPYYHMAHVVTAKDLLDTGMEFRPLFPYQHLELKGGVILPLILLRPEPWMVKHPLFDELVMETGTQNGKHYYLFGGLLNLTMESGGALELRSADSPRWSWVFQDYWMAGNDLAFITLPPPVEGGEPSFLFFSDLRPDLYFCGLAYRWYDSSEEVFIPVFAEGIGGRAPRMRPGEWRASDIGCWYRWGPYVYKAKALRFVEPPIPFESDGSGNLYPTGTYVVLGVPAIETTLYESNATRKVFTGRWIVNGTVWPGPYLNLDVIGWPVGDRNPKRWPRVDGGCDPGVVLCPVMPFYEFRLTGPNGDPIELDNFTGRYTGYGRVPWALGVTVLRLRHNTTAEPEYVREHLVSFRVPDGSSFLEGNSTGWYREGSVIRLPRLSDISVSQGTKLVHEGWRDSKGIVHRPGEEYVVNGPESFEPVMVRYHLVSVKGPHELRHSGSGWYRENSTAVLRVLENVTYVSDQTRYVFLGFRQGGSVVPELRIQVRSPVEVEAVWRREHRLTVESRFKEWEFDNPWYAENATYMMLITGGPEDLGNGTLIRIRAIEVRTGGVLYNAGMAPLESINFTIGGSPVTELWNATFTVHGPVKLRILWEVRYGIQVIVPRGTARVVNSTLPLPATVYAEEGEELHLELEQALVLNATRLVLHDVLLGSRSLGPVTRVTVRAEAPTAVLAVYRVQNLAFPRLRGTDGSVAEPDLVVLRGPFGEVESRGGSAVWLDVALTDRIGDISWEVVRAVYKGVDVTVPGNVTAAAPGLLEVPARIWRLRVDVRDLLGMPVPFARVSYRGPAGDVMATTGWSGTADLGVLPEGEALVEAVLLGSSSATVGSLEGPLTLVLPISPYTVALFASLLPAVFKAVRRGWR